MENKSVKKFELNTKILKDFDKIMSMKLDQIEELKITELDRSSKMFNIVSLCANLKTLILESDRRINTDKVLMNIFKPEKLENLVMNNVKVPTGKALKKFTNLKMISLNSIRQCEVKDFFGGLPNPEKIEILNITDSDMMNQSIQIIDKFVNLKYLKLERLTNFSLNHLDFLKENGKLLKINVEDMKVEACEVYYLMQCHCRKVLDLQIIDKKQKEPCFLKIGDYGQNELTVNLQDISEIVKNIPLYQIDKVILQITTADINSSAIDLLKDKKGNIEMWIKDFSILTVQQAEKMKNELEINQLFIKQGENEKKYEIAEFIMIRKEIDNILSHFSKHISQSEKFLEIYRYIGLNYSISEQNPDYSKKICTSNQMVELIQNCLEVSQISSSKIIGEDLEKDKTHTWLQVEVDKKWYHADILKDLENIKKKKALYCLRGDKFFLKTHTPKIGKNNYCPQDYNSKVIKVFFKTGLLKENLLVTYYEIAIEKIKKLMKQSKKEEILLLPSGKEDKS